MLVLSRKTGEEIIIAGDIRIQIVSIDGSRVRIGIEAPSSVHIIRKEVMEANADVKGQSHHKRART